MKKKRISYLGTMVQALGDMIAGLRLSGRHYVKGYKREAPLGIADPDYFKKDQGPITIQYPMQKVPVPDVGRYRLHMETDDCIGCDKCARICPVDCITIETFRADGDLGKTSDGTVKRLHLPTFDIDMGKCMYCGLCTTVCPTECLVMTPVYDYSEYDRDNFVYHFGAYSPVDEARIRLETESSLAAKKAAKSTPVTTEAPASESASPRPRPMMRPVMKPAPVTAESEVPVPKPEEPATAVEAETTPPIDESKPKPRPRPIMRPASKVPAPENSSESPPPETPTEVSPPTISVEGPALEVPAEPLPPESPPAPQPPKVRPRPIMRPRPKPEGEEGGPEA